MWALPVVVVDPRWERLSACGRTAERHGVGPLADQGLDEALGLAVGAGSIGPCSHVPDLVPLAAASEHLRDIGGPVVRQDAPDADPEPLEPGDRPAQELDRR